MGETIWAKIQYLLGFLEAKKRGVALEAVHTKKKEAKVAKLAYLQEHWPLHEALELEAEMMEIESTRLDTEHAYRLNIEELAMLNRLLEEAYELAEPTRIAWYSDEDMFEANACLEFTTVLAREIQSDILSMGRPSSAHFKNAMSNPVTWQALMTAWLIPEWVKIIGTQDFQIVLPDVEKHYLITN